MDEILGGTHDAHHREDSEGNGEISSVGIAEATVETGRYAVGNIVAAATATAALLGLVYLTVEDDGIHHLYNGNGHVLGGAAGIGNGAVIGRVGIALENADVALASVQDHLLLHDGDALKFLTASAAQTSLEHDLDIEFDGNRIKASVESYRIDPDICPGNTRAFGSDIGGMLQNIVSEVGKQNFYVLKAVSVSAGIENSIGLNADHFRSRRIAIRGTARKSVI